MHRLIPVIACAAFTTVASAEDMYTLSDDATTVRLVEEEVQWVPETITVLGKDELDAMYRVDLESLEGYVPGMIIDHNFGTTRGANISIRGIGSRESEKGIEPAVATYVDGVYLANTTGTMRSQPRTTE